MVDHNGESMAMSSVFGEKPSVVFLSDQEKNREQNSSRDVNVSEMWVKNYNRVRLTGMVVGEANLTVMRNATDNYVMVKPAREDSKVEIDGKSVGKDRIIKINAGNRLKMAGDDDQVYILERNSNREWVMRHIPRLDEELFNDKWKMATRESRGAGSDQVSLKNMREMLARGEQIEITPKSGVNFEPEVLKAKLNDQYRDYYTFDISRETRRDRGNVVVVYVLTGTKVESGNK